VSQRCNWRGIAWRQIWQDGRLMDWRNVTAGCLGRLYSIQASCQLLQCHLFCCDLSGWKRLPQGVPSCSKEPIHQNRCILHLSCKQSLWNSGPLWTMESPHVIFSDWFPLSYVTFIHYSLLYMFSSWC
jgi:hypothetical protein